MINVESILEDITYSLEQYYGGNKENVISVLNELNFAIFGSPHYVNDNLAEVIETYAKDNDRCSDCGLEVQYDYQKKAIVCENCGELRNM